MPKEESPKNISLFAQEVIAELKSWEA
jgi:hypothetical protein